MASAYDVEKEDQGISKGRKIVFGVACIAIVATALLWFGRKVARNDEISVLTGAIIANHTDPHLQRPLGNAIVTAGAGPSAGRAVSEASGLFRVHLQTPVPRDAVVELTVEHPEYQTFKSALPARDQIHVIRLVSRHPTENYSAESATTVSNPRVRYATRSTTTTTIGAAVRTFEIENEGNVPCARKPPCSPDGRWKATIGTLPLDTGEASKHFRNVRVSCIAGPCPFTAIETDKFSRGGQSILVSVRNWSDRVTYLLEAEVSQTMDSEMIRYTYPVTFGRSMNFTLPGLASGPSIEADINGSPIIFPLGPELRLSWAACRESDGPDRARQYRCELKPGYRFH